MQVRNLRNWCYANAKDLPIRICSRAIVFNNDCLSTKFKGKTLEKRCEREHILYIRVYCEVHGDVLSPPHSPIQSNMFLEKRHNTQPVYVYTVSRPFFLVCSWKYGLRQENACLYGLATSYCANRLIKLDGLDRILSVSMYM